MFEKKWIWGRGKPLYEICVSHGVKLSILALLVGAEFFFFEKGGDSYGRNKGKLQKQVRFLCVDKFHMPFEDNIGNARPALQRTESTGIVWYSHKAVKYSEVAPVTSELYGGRDVCCLSG